MGGCSFFEALMFLSFIQNVQNFDQQNGSFESQVNLLKEHNELLKKQEEYLDTQQILLTEIRDYLKSLNTIIERNFNDYVESKGS